MGRNKRRKLLQKPRTAPSPKKAHGIKHAAHPGSQRKKAQNPNPGALKTPLPFEPADKILLIGEGLSAPPISTFHTHTNIPDAQATSHSPAPWLNTTTAST